jgi:hypothetical protein
MLQIKHIKLSILIPSIPSRFDRMTNLVKKLEGQIAGRDDVELIVLVDNKKRTIGQKRDAIKDLATGEYFSMIDDDDDVSDDYVESLCDAISKYNVDVITFDSLVHIEGKTGVVNMSIFNENKQWSPDAVTYRQPFHMCAWKSNLFQRVKFPSMMYGEDAKWSERAMWVAQTEHHIDKILHHYYWDADITEAFERNEKQQ